MRRLAVALALLGLAVLLAAPALAGGPFVPRVVEFAQTLPGADRTPGAGAWRSGVVRAPKRFDLVGLTWRAPREAHARIRVRSSDGRWSPWTAMAETHGGGAGAEPVWAGGADAYELRLDRRPRGLRAHFVNATGTATRAARVATALRRVAHGALAAIAGTAARAQGATGAPAIVPREAWGAGQCPPRTAPSYGQVQLGFVHHTVDANTYGPQDSAAMVLAICRYHRNTNGWNDVGYNFLVDRYGQIFEGRAGGVDQPVIGAQAQGYNGISTGVANIGTFTRERQTPEAVRATAHLLAWKLPLHGAPVDGLVTVTSAGGPSNRYPVGTAVTFERIAGHRDADATACPGDALFAELPEIRRQAAALAPAAIVPRASVSIAVADPTLDFPQPALLSGQAADAAGIALASAPLSVQVATRTGFLTRARTTTGADGGWSLTLPTQVSRTLRAVVQLPGGGTASSPRIGVQVAPSIRLRAPRRVRARRPLLVSGSVRPRRVRLRLEIARQGRDRRMHVVARVPLRVRNGRFAARPRLRRAALHRLRVVSLADARNAAGRSGDVLVRATGGRR
ncbi:MAG TPA: N-acetylmuramoyl-L-alanine amidase [Solirubrobacteraceae bacterium]|nr:N-acetylmuramoyl-L-alanine amidase [Solirubrobacteraceae bacterium]